MELTEPTLAPLTDEELGSFELYAGTNTAEGDGSRCQWADYTLRLVAEVRRLRAEAERLKGEIQLITAPFEAGGGYNAALRARLAEAERERDALGVAVRNADKYMAKLEARVRELEALPAEELESRRWAITRDANVRIAYARGRADERREDPALVAVAAALNAAYKEGRAAGSDDLRTAREERRGAEDAARSMRADLDALQAIMRMSGSWERTCEVAAAHAEAARVLEVMQRERLVLSHTGEGAMTVLGVEALRGIGPTIIEAVQDWEKRKEAGK